VELLTANFSPVTGELQIPATFDNVERSKVGFETLTSTLGQNLVIQKLEDFVGQKTAFFIESTVVKTPVIEQNRETVLHFLKKDLGFIRDEIIQMTIPDLLCKYRKV
jgi:hypothetical protein